MAKSCENDLDHYPQNDHGFVGFKKLRYSFWHLLFLCVCVKIRQIWNIKKYSFNRFKLIVFWHCIIFLYIYVQILFCNLIYKYISFIDNSYQYIILIWKSLCFWFESTSCCIIIANTSSKYTNCYTVEYVCVCLCTVYQWHQGKWSCFPWNNVILIQNVSTDKNHHFKSIECSNITFMLNKIFNEISIWYIGCVCIHIVSVRKTL